jgi:hypothetical protein
VAATDDVLSELGEAGGALAEVVDSLYEMVAISQNIVQSASVLESAPWNLLKASVPTLIGAIAEDFLGSDNEENISLILEYNPTLIDVGIVPAGTELIIPVI